jgi:alpha-N-arabinofuranosidase
VRASEDFRYDLAVRRGPNGREAVLRRRLHGESRIVGRQPLGDGPLRLEVEATRSRYLFRAGAKANLAPMGTLPTRALSAESISASGPMCFTGVYIGLYATGHGRRSSVPADFDWFDYAPIDAGPDARPPRA